MEKFKSYIIIAGFIFTIGGMIISNKVSEARLSDKADRTEKQVTEQDTRVKTLETNYIEQKVVLDYIKKDVDESKEERKEMINLLQQIKNKE